jgi:hypothetical protein
MMMNVWMRITSIVKWVGDQTLNTKSDFEVVRENVMLELKWWMRFLSGKNRPMMLEENKRHRFVEVNVGDE